MAKLGVVGFGGPAVHVAMLRDETVRRRGWLSDAEFLDLFGAVSVLPGPSSTQLAMVLSRRRAGWAGLVLGGVCFIAPAMVIVLALAWAYTRYRTTPTGGGALYGIEPVVVAIVVVALWQLAGAALKRRWFVVIGVFALVGYFVGLNVLVVLAVGAAAVVAVDHRPRVASVPLLVLSTTSGVSAVAAAAHRDRPGLGAVLGEFLKLGVIVFGSGYVLLAFLRADLVGHLHWLTQRQVLDAVAAGQVTPGPVFTTATFVGYLIGGVPFALVATLGIFAPSFVMVAVLEPFVGRVRRSPWWGPALDGVTVAALGLMAAVTVDLGRTAVHDALTAALFVATLGALVRWRPNGAWLVAAGAAVGIAHAWW